MSSITPGKSKKALFVIDYQVDFVAESGILTAGKPGQAIEPAILELITTKRQAGYDIIFTLDTHSRNEWANHPEAASFPLHCELGTLGHELYGEVKNAALPTDIYIRKTSYGLPMNKWPGNYQVMEFAGVATHICVLQNVLTAYNNFSDATLILHQNAVASFDDRWHQIALEYMKDILQVTMV